MGLIQESVVLSAFPLVFCKKTKKVLLVYHHEWMIAKSHTCVCGSTYTLTHKYHTFSLVYQRTTCWYRELQHAIYCNMGFSETDGAASSLASNVECKSSVYVRA